MVLETNRSRLLNVWGGAEEEQRGWEIGWASPPYSLLLFLRPPHTVCLRCAKPMVTQASPAHTQRCKRGIARN